MPGEPSQDLLDALKRELESGENLVWKAAPDSKAFARGQRGLRVFGMVFGGFALLWIGAAFAMMGASTKSPPPVYFPLLGVPFLIIGCVLTFGTGWAAKRRAARTVYGLTPRRAIVIEGNWRDSVRSVYSYRASQLGTMSKHERPDGSGDLVFEEVDAGYTQNEQPVMRPRGFLGIADVHSVERLVKSTLQKQ